jgi:transcription termination/antitermination protein NusA
MGNEMMEALKLIAAEKNLKMDVVLDTLKKGLLNAAMKSYGTSENITVKVDHNTADIQIYAVKKVVEQVTDPRFEITTAAAKKIRNDAQLGEEVSESLNVKDFGRNAIQAIKQILIQSTREAERDNIFDNYKERIGEIVSCVVQQVAKGDIIVMIGKVEAILPRREQVKNERYFRGDTIRSMVLNVQKSAKGPQIVLTRNHPDFVKKLFEIEVPEIYEKIVEIKTVSREAGERTKIAVFSKDEKIDALGACVGMKGIRIQAVVRELNNEKIDIIPWSDDVLELTARAMSPAKVRRVIENEDAENSLYVIVDDDQLSIAIGKGGQNVKLASRLVQKDIDLMTESEYAQELESRERAQQDIESFAELDETVKDKLITAGFETLGDVADSEAAELAPALDGNEALAKEVHQKTNKFVYGMTEEETTQAAEPEDSGPAPEIKEKEE